MRPGTAVNHLVFRTQRIATKDCHCPREGGFDKTKDHISKREKKGFDLVTRREIASSVRLTTKSIRSPASLSIL